MAEVQLLGDGDYVTQLAYLNIFALEAGIAIGSALGGVILSEKHTGALPYAGAIFTLVALLAAISVERSARRRRKLEPAESAS